MSETAAARWDKTLKLFIENSYCTDPDSWFIAKFTHNTQHFLADDIVLGAWSNGSGERQPVCGRSSRGRDISAYYVQYARYKSTPRLRSWARAKAHPVPRWQWVDGPSIQHDNRSQVQILVLPHHLTNLSPDDAAIRAFVLAIPCAGGAASLVGASSQTFSITSRQNND